MVPAGKLVEVSRPAEPFTNVTAQPEGGKPIEFTVRVRIDTPKEREYFRHGGILQYVLRQLAAQKAAAYRSAAPANAANPSLVAAPPRA